MQGLCCLGDDSPGPLHSFKFRYTDDICSFLLVAHSLADAQLFTSKFVNIEEVVPLDVSSNNYIVGRKMPLEEGGGFQATFDLGLMLVAHPLSAARQLENGVVDIEETVADNIFIITVMQCEHSNLGVSYTVRDNFLVASADVKEAGLLVKRCSISSIPVFEVQGGVSAGDALSSVWLPGVVPPLIVGLESLLEMGDNAIITLPLKCNAPKGYYKAPPPHLLRQREEREDDSRKRNWSTACTLDFIIDLPKSRVAQAVTVSNS